MHLTAALHLGELLTPVQYELQGYEEAQYRIEDEPSKGFEVIDSILNWYNIGLNLDRDFLYVCDRIKELVEAKGINSTIATIDDPSSIKPNIGDSFLVGDNPVNEFAKYTGCIATFTGSNYVFEDKSVVGFRLLTEEEQQVCLHCRVGSVLDHYRIFGRDAVIEDNIDFHVKAKAARRTRLDRAEIYFYHELPTNYLTVDAEVANTRFGHLTLNFWLKGFRGTIEDQHPIFSPDPVDGIIDYVYGRSSFENSGLINKDWKPVSGMSLSDFCDLIYQILVLG